jgi:hypothetical protein
MKKFSTLFILLVAMICLAGCRYKIIDTETGEGTGTTVAGAVISGAMIYEDAKDAVSSATESLDAMVIDTTNAMLKPYESDRVKGSTVLSFIDKTEGLAEAEILPIPLVIIFEDGLDEDLIEIESYYKIEISDTLPEGAIDGFFDKAVISKAEVVTGSGE